METWWPEYPSYKGGMGVGISMSGLASAVANEGGIGVISAAGLGLVYKKRSKDFDKATLWWLKGPMRVVIWAFSESRSKTRPSHWKPLSPR